MTCEAHRNPWSHSHRTIASRNAVLPQTGPPDVRPSYRHSYIVSIATETLAGDSGAD